MIRDDRWSKLGNFENKQKALFLKNLVPRQSLIIYSNLYDLAYRIGAKRYCAEVNSEKIKFLAKRHSILGKVGL